MERQTRATQKAKSTTPKPPRKTRAYYAARNHENRPQIGVYDTFANSDLNRRDEHGKSNRSITKHRHESLYDNDPSWIPTIDKLVADGEEMGQTKLLLHYIYGRDIDEHGTGSLMHIGNQGYADFIRLPGAKKDDHGCAARDFSFACHPHTQKGTEIIVYKGAWKQAHEVQNNGDIQLDHYRNDYTSLVRNEIEPIANGGCSLMIDGLSSYDKTHISYPMFESIERRIEECGGEVMVEIMPNPNHDTMGYKWGVLLTSYAGVLERRTPKHRRACVMFNPDSSDNKHQILEGLDLTLSNSDIPFIHTSTLKKYFNGRKQIKKLLSEYPDWTGR